MVKESLTPFQTHECRPRPHINGDGIVQWDEPGKLCCEPCLRDAMPGTGKASEYMLPHAVRYQSQRVDQEQLQGAQRREPRDLTQSIRFPASVLPRREQLYDDILLERNVDRPVGSQHGEQELDLTGIVPNAMGSGVFRVSSSVSNVGQIHACV